MKVEIYDPLKNMGNSILPTSSSSMQVFSVKLDEWTDEHVDALTGLAGNVAVNSKYEANIPDNYTKPKPDSTSEERVDFIRRKYEFQQFLNGDLQLSCLFPPSSLSRCTSSNCYPLVPADKKHYEKQTTGQHFQGLGLAFRNSKKRSEKKPTKKSNSMAGMVAFVGLIKVNTTRGTNLAVREDKGRKKYLNPIWKESLMLSIPENVPPLKLIVYDKDKLTTDDFMGDVEIDIQPLLSAAKASESSSMSELTHLGKWKASQENMLVSDGVIRLEEGKVKQVISIKLQNVERGVMEIELECMPLTQ